MQERLLAPRTLHCTRGQLFWECPHLFANESHPYGIGSTLGHQCGRFTRTIPRITQGSDTVITGSIIQDVIYDWLILVQEYTKCKLTKDEDILVAISGFTKLLMQAQPDQYLAGLWKQSLCQVLLRHREARDIAHSSGDTCPTWRAPSWSWASYKGAVSWSQQIIPLWGSPIRTEGTEKLITLIDTDVVSESANQAGRLRSASITTQAALAVALAAYDAYSRANSQNGTISDEAVGDAMEMALSHGTASRSILVQTTGR